MNAPFIDIHTHIDRTEPQTITVRNIFPGEEFSAFSGRNFYSVGLHPWHLKEKDENNGQLRIVEEALEFDHVIMVGECGLDKMVNSNFEEQKRVFEVQSMMAEEFEYPLLIHCVKSFSELLEIHKRNRPSMPWIIHAYNGGKELTKQLVDKGFMFSFGKSLLQPNSKGRESFCTIPLERIFFESDESNVSLESIYTRAATLRAISINELKGIALQNFNRIENTIGNKS